PLKQRPMALGKLTHRAELSGEVHILKAAPNSPWIGCRWRDLRVSKTVQNVSADAKARCGDHPRGP
ncbi:MAG: hypothetical protein ACPGPH_07815, partial [Synechococcus sp.]